MARVPSPRRMRGSVKAAGGALLAGGVLVACCAAAPLVIGLLASVAVAGTLGIGLGVALALAVLAAIGVWVHRRRRCPTAPADRASTSPRGRAQGPGVASDGAGRADDGRVSVGPATDTTRQAR